MTLIDWTIVVVLNGAIILYGFVLSRGLTTSSDWFLASRRLPWWLVGLSMYATAIDTSDLVADSGATYTLGIGYLVTNWVGVVFGWSLAAFFVCLPMYRAGMYTNAEYLESRFGPATRLLCALIQVQFRTLVLGIISMTIYLTVTIVCGWQATAAWIAVGSIAVLASIYTAFGGLRSVAVTDVLQFFVMTTAALVIWFVIWNQVGGWQGMETRLAAADESLPGQLLKTGSDSVTSEDVSEVLATNDEATAAEKIRRKLLLGGRFDERSQTITRTTPAWMVSLGLVIVGVAYSIVNHTQSMRMFAAKNEWHLKMTVFAAGSAMLFMCFFNLTMGIMGRALFPDQALLPEGNQDAVYPFLVAQFATTGLKGLVVAGILAAALSTYDSIGSTLSALMTRDVYARFIVTDRDDRHYLRVGQWLTPVIIGISFLYVPFFEGGMLLFFLELTSTFVVPLLTLFLMGTLTRVNRHSGWIALLVGAAYGTMRLSASWLAEKHGIAVLTPIMANSFAAYPISMLITGGTMVLLSMFWGWEAKSDISHQEKGAWLRSSQESVRQLVDESDEDSQPFSAPWLPGVLAVLVTVIGCLLSFVVFR